MGLQDKLDEYKKSFLEKAPAEAVEVMQRATEDLKNSGILDKVIKVGVSAPRPTPTAPIVPSRRKLWKF